LKSRHGSTQCNQGSELPVTSNLSPCPVRSQRSAPCAAIAAFTCLAAFDIDALSLALVQSDRIGEQVLPDVCKTGIPLSAGSARRRHTIRPGSRRANGHDQEHMIEGGAARPRTFSLFGRIVKNLLQSGCNDMLQ